MIFKAHGGMLSESAPLISQLSKYLAGSGAGLVVMLSPFVLIVITA